MRWRSLDRIHRTQAALRGVKVSTPPSCWPGVFRVESTRHHPQNPRIFSVSRPDCWKKGRVRIDFQEVFACDADGTPVRGGQIGSRHDMTHRPGGTSPSRSDFTRGSGSDAVISAMKGGYILQLIHFPDIGRATSYRATSDRSRLSPSSPTTWLGLGWCKASM